MPKRRSLGERFWAKVDRRSADECWPWTAGNPSRRYGCIWSGPGRASHLRSNRASWELTFGPIPDGLFVLHSCDNHKCCNPGHLFLGTQADNVRDMEAKKRASHPRGENQGSAKLTDSQVIEIRGLAGLVTQVKLAAIYQVGQSQISRIILRKEWGHI